MSAPVFISYASKDIEVARKICRAVEERGFACWMAHRDVGPGENFQIAIVRAIRAARVMLVVFTANANKSAEVEKEVVLAGREHLTIIPIRIERVEPSEAFDLQFTIRQWIDLFEDWDHEIKRLTQSLERATSIPATTAKPAAPSETAKSAKPPSETPPPRISPTPIADSPAAAKPASPGIVTQQAKPPSPSADRKRMDGHEDQAWAMAAVLTIAAVSAILAMLLTRDQSVSTDLRNWTSPLLAVVAVASLIAMTFGLARLAGSEGGSFNETLQRSLIAIGLTLIVWGLYGYSLAFTGGGDFVGGFARAFLHDVGGQVSTYTTGVTIAELSFLIFQGCVASLTLVLVVAAVGNQMRFAALTSFVPLWATLIYVPLVHMAWYWPGADAIANAGKALAAAADAGARTAAQARLDEISVDAGWLFKKGALDYAGGAVVAISAGMAGVVGFLFVGSEKGKPGGAHARTAIWPSALGLMWLGWFGLNAASNLDFGDYVTRLAMANCLSASAAAAAAGMMTEWMLRGRLGLAGVLYGALGGIIAVTPASAFAGTAGTILLGVCAGIVAGTAVGGAFAPLPTLPLVYLANGTLGTLATAILVNPSLGGTGIMDYVTGKIADYDFPTQMIAQFQAVAAAVLWSGVASAIVYAIVKAAIGLQSEVKQPGS